MKTPAIVASIGEDAKHAALKKLMRDVGNNSFMMRDTRRDQITLIPNDKEMHGEITFIIRGLSDWITADESTVMDLVRLVSTLFAMPILWKIVYESGIMVKTTESEVFATVLLNLRQSIKKGENRAIPPKCINCNGNHTANNYNECEFYIEAIKPKIEFGNGDVQNIENAKSSVLFLKPQQSLNNQSSKNEGSVLFSKIMPSTAPNHLIATNK